MKKYLTISFLIGCMVMASASLFAQADSSKIQPVASKETTLMALAKAAQNPVADMNTVPFQFNWLSGGGLGNRTLSQTLVQPVLPLPISKDFNVVSRTIVPILSIPVSGGSKLNGIGDIQEQLYFSPAHSKGLIWGAGPVISFPTSTISEISTGQFAVGPTAVLLGMPGKFVVGIIANQLWSISGSSNGTTAINSFFTQPFINYNLKLGWSLTTAPSITANWAAPSGQKWTVPLGMGVAKITTIGKQPFSLSLQYYHNVVRPSSVGADQVRMAVAVLFPR